MRFDLPGPVQHWARWNRVCLNNGRQVKIEKVDAVGEFGFLMVFLLPHGTQTTVSNKRKNIEEKTT